MYRVKYFFMILKDIENQYLSNVTKGFLLLNVSFSIIFKKLNPNINSSQAKFKKKIKTKYSINSSKGSRKKKLFS